MEIFIPTLGRADNQKTLSAIPLARRNAVTLVVQKHEAGLYAPFKKAGIKLAVLPPKYKTIAPTRHYIFENLVQSAKFIMLDDDLTFSTRRKDDKEKFVQATEKDMISAFNALEKVLDKYAHAGLLCREGGNRITTPTVKCVRQMRVLAYRTDILKHHKIKFDRVETPEDFDVTLQLLYKGFENILLCSWVHNQSGFNAPGGCSIFRDLKFHNDAHHKFAMLHPKFVKTRMKSSPYAFNGEPRVETTISWKKAYQSSQE